MHRSTRYPRAQGVAHKAPGELAPFVFAAIFAGATVPAGAPIIGRPAASFVLSPLLSRPAILPGAPLGPGIAARHSAIMTRTAVES